MHLLIEILLQDAFISRIHVQLLYQDFTEDERQKVWKTFSDKLNEDRGTYIRISMDAKDYIDGKEVQAIKWNGREIRNGKPIRYLSSYKIELQKH